MRAVQQDVDGGECHQGFGGCEARRRRIKPAQKSCLYRREEKKKRRRFQQWSGFKFFYFILGLIIAWEISGGKIWRMNR